MSCESFVRINRNWVDTVAEAIGARHGVLFKDALESAEQGSAVQIAADTIEVINYVVDTVGDLLVRAVEEYTSKHPLIPLTATSSSSSSSSSRTFVSSSSHYANENNATTTESNVQALMHKENEWCIRVFVRVAITGALARYQVEHKKIIYASNSNNCKSANVHNSNNNNNNNSNNDVTDDDTKSANKEKNYIEESQMEEKSKEEELQESKEKQEEQQLKESVHNTLLTGLLFAFEAFQEVHSCNRDHYPPRSKAGTAGTVGWDTLVLLHFTHHIPQVAREASAHVVDEACGQLVRGWRRLLVALQSIDPHEAPQHSRRRGALSVVNGLLMILFPRYNTHQCNVLLQAVDHAEEVASRSSDYTKSILAPSQHMISEIVTYFYHKGRLHLYEGKYKIAHEALQRAYTLLPPIQNGNEAQQKNKLRVRFFLVVSGLCSGYEVLPEIMYGSSKNEFGVNDVVQIVFKPLQESIKNGDVNNLITVLEEHGVLLRRRGVYLALMQTILFAHLLLLVRVHKALSSLPNTDPSRITVHTLESAYKYMTNAKCNNENAISKHAENTAVEQKNARLDDHNNKLKSKKNKATKRQSSNENEQILTDKRSTFAKIDINDSKYDNDNSDNYYNANNVMH